MQTCEKPAASVLFDSHRRATFSRAASHPRARQSDGVNLFIARLREQSPNGCSLTSSSTNIRARIFATMRRGEAKRDGDSAPSSRLFRESFKRRKKRVKRGERNISCRRSDNRVYAQARPTSEAIIAMYSGQPANRRSMKIALRSSRREKKKHVDLAWIPACR